MTTVQLSLMLLIYTFIDAMDNPVYGFLSDRTRTRWGRRRPWLAIGTPLLVLCFIAFYSPPAFWLGIPWLSTACFFICLPAHWIRSSMPITAHCSRNCSATMPTGPNKCPPAGFSAGCHDHQHRPDTHGDQCPRIQPNSHTLWPAGWWGDPVYDALPARKQKSKSMKKNPSYGTASRICSRTGNSGWRDLPMLFIALPCHLSWFPCPFLSNMPWRFPIARRHSCLLRSC